MSENDAYLSGTSAGNQVGAPGGWANGERPLTEHLDARRMFACMYLPAATQRQKLWLVSFPGGIPERSGVQHSPRATSYSTSSSSSPHSSIPLPFGAPTPLTRLYPRPGQARLLHFCFIQSYRVMQPKPTHYHSTSAYAISRNYHTVSIHFYFP